MGRRTESTEFLKECMADALLFLMRDKPFAKITADEICLRAGVGRATWFRQFSSKESALVFKVQVLWQRWLERENTQASRSIASDNPHAIFFFFFENRAVFETIYAAGIQHVVFEWLNGAVSSVHDSCGQSKYVNGFMVYGLLGVVDLWIRGGFKESPAEMNKLAKDTIVLTA